MQKAQINMHVVWKLNSGDPKLRDCDRYCQKDTRTYVTWLILNGQAQSYYMMILGFSLSPIYPLFLIWTKIIKFYYNIHFILINVQKPSLNKVKLFLARFWCPCCLPPICRFKFLRCFPHYLDTFINTQIHL